MPSRGGTFRNLVELQSRSQAQGSAGGQTDDWTTYATVYASIVALGGHEPFAARAARSAVTHQITLYWTPTLAITAAHRVKFGARIFDIESVANDDEANRVFILQAVEGATQG
jgi:SPP1 family predicted phage head-tail adaptor